MPNSPESSRKQPSRSERKKNRLSIPSAHPPKPIKKTLSRADRKVSQVGTPPPPPKVNKTRRLIITLSSIFVAIALIAGAAYYLIVLAPLQHVLITVGSDNIDTGYFLQRVVANPSGSSITSTIQLVISELLVKQQASAEGIAPVTSQDIDSYLRTQAETSLASSAASDNTAGTTTTDAATPTDTTTTAISDSAYNNWVKQQLADTGLSMKEYRQVALYNIQRQRLVSILSAQIPSSVDQYHVYAMYFNSNAAALTAKAKVTNLSDFNTVANTNAGQTNGGDLDWMPLAVLPVQLEVVAKNLAVGTCSDPITYQSGSSLDGSLKTSYWLLWLAEGPVSRAVTPSQLSALQGNSVDNWLNSKAQQVTITLHDRNGTAVNANTGTLDNDTLSWLNYQIQKYLKRLPSQTTTTSIATTTTTTTPASTTITTTSP